MDALVTKKPPREASSRRGFGRRVGRLAAGLGLAAAALAGCSAPASSTDAPESGTVSSVTDGDTIRVRTGGRDERVRLVGIDGPESRKPGTPVECGAREASTALKELAAGKRVRLSYDVTQDRRDRFDRLLAHVSLRGDEKTLGEHQLEAGHAKVYVYERPFRLLPRYKAAEARARLAGHGVWSSCGGDFHSSR